VLAGALVQATIEGRPFVYLRLTQQHLVVQVVASRQRLASVRSVALAEQVNRLPGWQLEMVYVPEPPLIEDQEQLLDGAARARELAAHDPGRRCCSAGLALEGTLHRPLASEEGPPSRARTAKRPSPFSSPRRGGRASKEPGASIVPTRSSARSSERQDAPPNQPSRWPPTCGGARRLAR